MNAPNRPAFMLSWVLLRETGRLGWKSGDRNENLRCGRERVGWCTILQGVAFLKHPVLGGKNHIETLKLCYVIDENSQTRCPRYLQAAV